VQLVCSSWPRTGHRLPPTCPAPASSCCLRLQAWLLLPLSADVPQQDGIRRLPTCMAQHSQPHCKACMFHTRMQDVLRQLACNTPHYISAASVNTTTRLPAAVIVKQCEPCNMATVACKPSGKGQVHAPVASHCPSGLRARPCWPQLMAAGTDANPGPASEPGHCCCCR
jgi:hypothetical protein